MVFPKQINDINFRVGDYVAFQLFYGVLFISEVLTSASKQIVAQSCHFHSTT